MAKSSAVRIGDLKNNLSAHLRRVRQGEEILVCDRETPIARIVPLMRTNPPQTIPIQPRTFRRIEAATL